MGAFLALILFSASPAQARIWGQTTGGQTFSSSSAQASAQARDQEGSTDALATIALKDLPATGQAVYALILQGGPFAFDKDGSVFGNYERRLPKQARGYYHEYTVPKHARSRTRGTQRIICGGQQITAPDVCYYTADHYNSFARILTAGKRP